MFEENIRGGADLDDQQLPSLKIQSQSCQMIVKNKEQLLGLRRIGSLVAYVLEGMIAQAVPGASLLELDRWAQAEFSRLGARSAPIQDYKFPGATCLSLSPVVAHGIPENHRLQNGDLLNIDVSAELGGFYGDTGGSLFVGEAPEHGLEFLRATREARDAGIGAARAECPLSDIGRAIEKVAEHYHLQIIENLGSHGLGKKLHEEPKFIPGFFDPTEKRILKENQVITVEPFLSTRSQFVDETPDGWTLVGDKGGWSAQFEHSLVVFKDSVLILTDSSYFEDLGFRRSY